MPPLLLQKTAAGAATLLSGAKPRSRRGLPVRNSRPDGGQQSGFDVRHLPLQRSQEQSSTKSRAFSSPALPRKVLLPTRPLSRSEIHAFVKDAHAHPARLRRLAFGDCAINCGGIVFNAGQLILLRLFTFQIRAVPPSAAKSLEKRGGVGIAICLGLNENNGGLVVSLFGA